jgi:ribosomal protein L9
LGSADGVGEGQEFKVSLGYMRLWLLKQKTKQNKTKQNKTKLKPKRR